MDTINERVARYVHGMVDRGRTVIVYEDGVPTVWCTFFIFENMDQVKEHYERPVWGLSLDFREGNVVYIDKIICARRWSVQARKELQRVILARFPALEWAVWHRPGEEPERCIVRRIRKERVYEEV